MSGIARRLAAAWRVLTAPLPPPRSFREQRVLQVTLGGVFHAPVPDGYAEGVPGWEAWIDQVIADATHDGRWNDCISIADISVVFLAPSGRGLRAATSVVGDRDV